MMKKNKLVLLSFILVLLLSITACSSPTSSTTNATTTATVLQIGSPAPDATFTDVQGNEFRLSDFKGEKIMFWFFSTWCSTCVVSVRSLEKNNAQLNGMRVIAVRTYNNAGYPGPLVSKFALEHAPLASNYPNWVWGDATAQGASIYDSKNYPDIFYLIDEEGILRSVQGAPINVMDEIIAFANE